MPDIPLSDRNFERLQRLAIPFVDTPDTTIGRLLDEHEANSKTDASSTNGKASQGLILDLDSPDDLTFTRVRSASFGDTEISRPNWNKLVRVAHSEAKKQVGAYRDLVSITIANIQEGKNEDYGFSYVPEADISVQGLAANLAWQSSLKLARYLNVPIRVIFEWYDKDAAAHPGKRGILEWTPQ